MKDITTLNQNKARSIIGRISLFNAFSEDEKDQMASFYTRFYLYNEDEVIVKEGDTDTNLFILLAGKAKVHKLPSTDALAQVTPGEMFGEVCFLTRDTRITSVSAEQQSIVLEIDEGMMQLFSSTVREKIKDQIINKLISRLDEMNKKLTEVSINMRAGMH